MLSVTKLSEELRAVPVFADLAQDDLAWLADQMAQVDLAPGDTYIHEGDPADHMYVLLEGDLRLRIESKSETSSRIFSAPMITGMLPYSRMTHFPATIRAVTAARVAAFPAEGFPEMLARIPVLGPRLVALLSDRIRDFTRLQDQQDKMAALGKISAGLAHELNNPAAAAQRAVASLRDALRTFREAAARLDAHTLTAEQRAAVPEIEKELGKRKELPRPWIHSSAAIAKRRSPHALSATAFRMPGTSRPPWWMRTARAPGSSASPSNSRRRPGRTWWRALPRR